MTEIKRENTSISFEVTETELYLNFLNSMC